MKRAQDAEAQALERAHARRKTRAARPRSSSCTCSRTSILELEPVGRLGHPSRDLSASGHRLLRRRYLRSCARHKPIATARSRLVRYGHVLRYQGKPRKGAKVLTEATGVLARLRREGDNSETTVVGLGLGLMALGRVTDSQNKPVEAQRHAEEAVTLAHPVHERRNARPRSVPSGRMALASLYLGFVPDCGGRRRDAGRQDA
jgi:hypothetical protein